FTHAQYEIRISDCTRLQSLAVSSGGSQTVFDSDELTAESNGACFARYLANGNAGSIAATAQFDDGVSLHHQESFHFENQPPTIEVTRVGVTGGVGEQRLVVELAAADDVDLSHLEVEAVGLRASDLRAVGGVVAKARERAFAGSD